LKISVDELNGNLKRKAEPLEREAEQIRNRLTEIEEEVRRYVKALGQGKLSTRRLEAEINAWGRARRHCNSNTPISSER